MESVLTPKAERIIAVIVGAISLTTVAVTPWPTIDELLGIPTPPRLQTQMECIFCTSLTTQVLESTS